MYASHGLASTAVGDNAGESLGSLVVALEVVSWGIVYLDTDGVEFSPLSAGHLAWRPVRTASAAQAADVVVVCAASHGEDKSQGENDDSQEDDGHAGKRLWHGLRLQPFDGQPDRSDFGASSYRGRHLAVKPVGNLLDGGDVAGDGAGEEGVGGVPQGGLVVGHHLGEGLPEGLPFVALFTRHS